VRAAPDKAGVTNLIDILAVARGTGRAEIEREFEGAGYGDFKKAVADGVVDLLGPVRERYAELRPDEAALEATLAAGAEKARAIAAVTVADVRAKMGFGSA
jgi:tryptophanyl-tRNA synthetase